MKKNCRNKNNAHYRNARHHCLTAAQCFPSPSRECVSHSVLSLTLNVWLSVTPWTVATRLFCPWNSSDKSAGVGWLSFLRGIFPTHGLNSGLLHCGQILHHLGPQGSLTPRVNPSTSFFFVSFIFISWRLITLQYCSDFCHTLTWISHGFTCVPHPDPPSHLPPHLYLFLEEVCHNAKPGAIHIDPKFKEFHLYVVLI